MSRNDFFHPQSPAGRGCGLPRPVFSDPDSACSLGAPSHTNPPLPKWIEGNASIPDVPSTFPDSPRAGRPFVRQLARFQLPAIGNIVPGVDCKPRWQERSRPALPVSLCGPRAIPEMRALFEVNEKTDVLSQISGSLGLRSSVGFPKALAQIGALGS